MTGHIRQRGERSWELKYDVGTDPLTGRRKTRYRAFKGTKRAAKVELARLVAEHAAGKGVDPTKQTVGEFLTTWLSDWAQQNVGRQTFQQYETLIRLYVVPRIGAVAIQKLHPQHLQQLYAGLLRDGAHDGRPLSPRSVHHVYKAIRRALTHAQTWGTIAANPAKAVRPPPVPHAEVQILTEQQIGQLLNHLEGQPMRPLISLLLGTGLRRGEALALTWKDVDLDRGVITVRAALEQTRKGLRVRPPKSRAGRRSVSLSTWLIAELRAHRARQQEQRLALGLGRTPDDHPLFAELDGRWRSPKAVSLVWSRLADKLGFPDVVLHALRHTHVSQLIAAGVDVLTVSRRIGHANASITLNIYSHLFGATDQKAAEAAETMFRGVRTAATRGASGGNRVAKPE